MRLGGLKKTGAQLIPKQTPAQNQKYITEVDLLSKPKKLDKFVQFNLRAKNMPFLCSF